MVGDRGNVGCGVERVSTRSPQQQNTFFCYNKNVMTLKAKLANYKYLIFDFDGTLVDSERPHYQSFSQTLATIGLKYVSFEEHCQVFLGTGSKHILKTILQKNNQEVNDAKIDNLIDLKRKIYDEIINAEGVSQIPGASEFLKNCKTEGKKMAIVSGGLKFSVEQAFALSGLPDVFDFFITSEDVAKTKPDPEGFLKAAERLGARVEDVIVFEDATNGVEAARAGGLECIGVGTYLPAEKFQAIYLEIILIKDYLIIPSL